MTKHTHIIAIIIFSFFLLNSCSQDDTCTEQTWYQDSDGDGFGNLSNSKQSCTQPEGYVSDNTDFDDNNSTSNPDAIELCNGIDDNGNGIIDENATICGELNVCENGTCVTAVTYYKDADGDLFGNPNDSIIAGNNAPTNYVIDNTDCDDMNSSINPEAKENLSDSVDNNCNGEVDELIITGETWFFQRDDSTSCSNGGSLGGGEPYDFVFLNNNTVSFTDPGSLSSSSFNLTGANLTLEMVYLTEVRAYKFIGNYVYSENTRKFLGSFIYTAYEGLNTNEDVKWTCEGSTEIFK
ncbi:putative metal-binding motif-containing protein [Cellulophaga baltica]|uniref:Lipoprotein n=1 Tax=Cellulophaga baltica 18 TaxID=1348584 RepID=A0AAU8RNU7_9FLAO|nr:putative metal-binding motif-containing protein [Cellulophaga baltica]AIZ42363.1 hypothetical protein M666_12690 [Cellulophaga baltica 18]WFO17204.1 putative metal-binding motif-containing protein [Cellulophaga baltica 4]